MNNTLLKYAEVFIHVETIKLNPTHFCKKRNKSRRVHYHILTTHITPSPSFTGRQGDTPYFRVSSRGYRNQVFVAP